MKITNDTVDLICQLEYLLGCHVVAASGDQIKYPVTAKAFCYDDKRLDESMSAPKYWLPIEYGKDGYDFGEPATFIGNLHYKFGSNHLYIGDGIVDMLGYLEKRYGIDFNELEAKRASDQK